MLPFCFPEPRKKSRVAHTMWSSPRSGVGLTVPRVPLAGQVTGSEQASPGTPFRPPLSSSCHTLATPLTTSTGHGGDAVYAVPPSGVALQVQARLSPRVPPYRPQGYGRENQLPFLCCRQAWQGQGRHYRAAFCTELKQPLTIQEVAPRPVGPQEVG